MDGFSRLDRAAWKANLATGTNMFGSTNHQDFIALTDDANRASFLIFIRREKFGVGQ